MRFRFEPFKLVPVLASFCILLVHCQDELPEPGISPSIVTRFQVDHYDIFLEIDPERSVFRSQQQVTITALQSTTEIEFELHADLLIDSLYIQNLGVKTLLDINQNKVSEIKYQRGTEEENFSRYQIQLIDPIGSGQTLGFFIGYHMNPDRIRSSLRSELLKFDVTHQGIRALHPVNGIFPYFGGLVAAPFKMELKHPVDLFCCVPGNLVDSNIEAAYVTDRYETKVALIPVFSLGLGTKLLRSAQEVMVEYYLVPDQSLPDAMINNTAKITQLYNEYFADPGTITYRFAFVKVPSSSITGESKGNAIYFAQKDDKYFHWDAQSTQDFMQLISHEIFHNWNIWYLRWHGKLYEWFVEGGAGFMAAWTNEKILGMEAARNIRAGFAKAFSDRKGYNAVRNLENAQKNNSEERSLIYSYGALVWEQFRMKLGDEAFFSGLSDFFHSYGGITAGSEEFFATIQKYTEVDVDVYLNQWIKNNAKIDLKLNKVSTKVKDQLYETTVSYSVETEKDYELFTAFGFRTSTNGNLKFLPAHLTKKGDQTFVFQSIDKPVFIQIDPNFQVPQTDITNDIWSK